MEGKTNFRGAWNSLMAWPDWTWPPVYFTTDLRHYLLSHLLQWPFTVKINTAGENVRQFHVVRVTVYVIMYCRHGGCGRDCFLIAWILYNKSYQYLFVYLASCVYYPSRLYNDTIVQGGAKNSTFYNVVLCSVHTCTRNENY